MLEVAPGRVRARLGAGGRNVFFRRNMALFLRSLGRAGARRSTSGRGLGVANLCYMALYRRHRNVIFLSGLCFNFFTIEIAAGTIFLHTTDRARNASLLVKRGGLFDRN